MKVGLPDEAAFIGKVNPHSKAPKGWKKVGKGASRTAFLGPSGFVYKIPNWEEESEVSDGEIKLARRIRKVKHLDMWDVKIPTFTPYKVIGHENHKVTVNAMEYLPSELYCECDSYYSYKGRKPCNCRKFGDQRPCFALVTKFLEDVAGLCDMWGGNLSYNNKAIWIIDLGEYGE